MASVDDPAHKDGVSEDLVQVEQAPGVLAQHEDSVAQELTNAIVDSEKARIEEIWKKMNGPQFNLPKPSMKKLNSSRNKNTKKEIPSWMVTLGLAPVNKPTTEVTLGKRSASMQNGTSEESKKVAAAALSAAKDFAAAIAAAGRGKIEITEVRDFAGEDIEVKKLVDADSKEAAEKGRVTGTPSSALDTILEQIKKKQKLSVLDKTKKDWSEFKDENKGMEEELGSYKKSSNQYLDKVSFLQRADHREFERERDARLAVQAKRRTDLREDDL